MGQGAEDAGGYEIDYDPYYDGLETGTWTQKNGASIHVSKMTKGHLGFAIRICERAKALANFSCDEEKWDEWIQLFEQERYGRTGTPKKKKKAAPKQAVRGKTRKMQCHCGDVYNARVADLKRGWAQSCSKTCASIRREYGRPAATPAKKVDK